MNFRISKAEYLMDFWVYPVLAALLAIAAIRQPGVHVASALGLVCVGALAWSFVEYVIHRWMFHGSLDVAREHQEHHDRPAAYIGLSGWYTLLAFTLVFAVLRFLAGESAYPLVLGFMLGYYLYISLHYCFHHKRIAPGSMLYALKVRHVRHHAGAKGNFGVTSPMWDKFFRTFS